MNKSKALKSLKFAGRMGHEFIALRPDYSVYAETTTKESALKYAKEVKGSTWRIEVKAGKRIYHYLRP